MPSLSDVLAFREQMFKRSFDLVQQKGADYNRDQQQEGDTLFNLKVCELLGVVETTEQGILVRLSDKFMRLISLTKTAGREPSVKNESVLDTVADVHNYVDYLALKYLERQLVENMTLGGGGMAPAAPGKAMEESRENYALQKAINRDIHKDFPGGR